MEGVRVRKRGGGERVGMSGLVRAALGPLAGQRVRISRVRVSVCLGTRRGGERRQEAARGGKRRQEAARGEELAASGRARGEAAS